MNSKWKTSVVTGWMPFRRLKHMQKYDFFYISRFRSSLALLVTFHNNSMKWIYKVPKRRVSKAKNLLHICVVIKRMR